MRFLFFISLAACAEPLSPELDVSVSSARSESGFVSLAETASGCGTAASGGAGASLAALATASDAAVTDDGETCEPKKSERRGSAVSGSTRTFRSEVASKGWGRANVRWRVGRARLVEVWVLKGVASLVGVREDQRT